MNDIYFFSSLRRSRPCIQVITCPTFTKLEWLVHLHLVWTLIDLDADLGYEFHMLDEVTVLGVG